MQLSLSSFPQISSYDPYCGLWGCQNVWTGCDLSSFMTLTLPRQGVAVLVLPLHFQSLSGLPDSSSSSSSSRSECSSSSSITKASSSTPVSSASSRAWVQLNTWYAGGHPCLHHTFSLAHMEHTSFALLRCSSSTAIRPDNARKRLAPRRASIFNSFILLSVYVRFVQLQGRHFNMLRWTRRSARVEQCGDGLQEYTVLSRGSCFSCYGSSEAIQNRTGAPFKEASRRYHPHCSASQARRALVLLHGCPQMCGRFKTVSRRWLESTESYIPEPHRKRGLDVVATVDLVTNLIKG
jgi:hypothetical protein